MRIRLSFAIGLILACQGCGPLAHVGRTSILEPTEYARRINDAEDCTRNKKLAEMAWAEFLQHDTANTLYSPHFQQGFLDGYADYLYAGGNGHPPPVPPRCYWRSEYETPEGHQAIKDWFTGFREGAAAAIQSGNRELVTLPFSSPPPPPVLPPVPPRAPPAADLGRPRSLPPPQEELQMPEPEKIPGPRKEWDR